MQTVSVDPAGIAQRAGQSISLNVRYDQLFRHEAVSGAVENQLARLEPHERIGLDLPYVHYLVAECVQWRIYAGLTKAQRAFDTACERAPLDFRAKMDRASELNAWTRRLIAWDMDVFRYYLRRYVDSR